MSVVIHAGDGADVRCICGMGRKPEGEPFVEINMARAIPIPLALLARVEAWGRDHGMGLQAAVRALLVRALERD